MADFQLNYAGDKINELLYKVENICDIIYPVGSFYMSANSTSPASLFGGTWEQIKDKFILAAGDDYEAGTEGGEAEHTLTIAEMPAHTHNFSYGITTGSPGMAPTVMSDNSYSASFANTGGDKPHNNMPPYLTAYIWKRVA